MNKKSSVLEKHAWPGISYLHAGEHHKNEEPLVFIHGMFGYKEQFKQWMEYLSEKYCIESYSVDLQYHGKSTHLQYQNYTPYKKLSVENYTWTVLGLCNIAERPIHLVGHSLGALVSQRVSVHDTNSSNPKCGAHKQIKSLVSLMSAAPKGVYYPLSVAIKFCRWRYILPMLTGGPLFITPEDKKEILFNGPEKGHPADGNHLLNPEPGRVVRELFMNNIKVDESQIGCAHTIVAGEYDMAAPKEMQIKIHQKFKGSQFITVPSGHMVMYEDPENSIIDAVMHRHGIIRSKNICQIA